MGARQKREWPESWEWELSFWDDLREAWNNGFLRKSIFAL